MRVEHSITIAAPVSRVWELTVDVESWPTISPTFTSIERLDRGPLKVGSTAQIKQPGQPVRTWTVTVLEPEHRFAWSAKAMGTSMTAGHVLVESDGETRNTLIVDIEGALSPIVGALIRGPVAKAIATENEGFRVAAQR